MIPNVHEFDREIPEGKVLIAEYRDITDEDRRSKREVLDTKLAGFKGKTEYKLVAVHAGWAIAGSCMRWDNGYFSVCFEDDRGSRHGRGFTDYAAAKEAFDKVKSY